MYHNKVNFVVFSIDLCPVVAANWDRKLNVHYLWFNGSKLTLKYDEREDNFAIVETEDVEEPLTFDTVLWNREDQLECDLYWTQGERTLTTGI